MKSAHIPYVIEKTKTGETTYDIYSRLLQERIVMLSTEIDEDVASSIVAQMLFLENENSQKPINFYINSPGGSVTHGLAIYDTMQWISSPVYTTCIGSACSMAAILLSSGEK